MNGRPGWNQDRQWADAIPSMPLPISMIAHAPSAEDVATYYNTMLAGAGAMEPHGALVLTGIWLKGQMDAVIERVKQGSSSA